MNAVNRPAGFWKRYVAYSIDALLLWAVLEGLARLFVPDLGMGEVAHLQTLLGNADPDAGIEQQAAVLTQAVGLLTRLTLWLTLAWALVGGAYFIGFESSGWQATPGKRLVGIKVTDADGARIGGARAAARFLAAGLSWAVLNLGQAMAAIPPEHRALHDLIAGTRVVDADPARTDMPWWGWLVVAASVLAFVTLIVTTVFATWQAVAAIGQV
ncbi:MAG: RDD family protein [Proteobacteria bacterium]|nr:RDD family protein [Pseudomonadota bacterium]